MAWESWRLSRAELRENLNKYERAVEDDARYLLQPSAAERSLLGDEVLRGRAEAVRQARDQNRRFVEAVIEDLPDICAGPDALLVPPRPLAEVRCLEKEAPALPSSSYGSLASVFLHLLRDWSTSCDHVISSTYEPAVAELCALLPAGGDVLVPGAGLGRLALQLAGRGFQVEANDASRLFLTVADFVLNRAPASGLPLNPLAHVFTENWGHEQQYLDIRVPAPVPAAVAARAPDGAAADGQPKPPLITLVPGDFVKTYGAGCCGHRKFDAIVTCFFIDTATDVAELFTVMDSLLGEGGVWINIGPLNWKKDARLKLCWNEILCIWKRLGYEFVSNKAMDCDYHLPRGRKMYTESYQCSLTAAVKRRTPA